MIPYFDIDVPISDVKNIIEECILHTNRENKLLSPIRYAVSYYKVKLRKAFNFKIPNFLRFFSAGSADGRTSILIPRDEQYAVYKVNSGAYQPFDYRYPTMHAVLRSDPLFLEHSFSGSCKCIPTEVNGIIFHGRFPNA